MPTVPASRLKGNYGAAVVTTRLSGECLVRPVQGDTDVGLDLYCETVIENRPFLHFWIQVKAGEQCKLDEGGTSVSCRFDTEHLMYWRRQPVPVFAALVPSDWPPEAEPDVWIIDVTTKLIFGDISSAGSSAMLRSDYQWPPGARAPVQSFLRDTVPVTTARLQCYRGIVAAVPTLTPEYVRNTPPVPVLRFKDNIRDQLRTTAANSIFFSLLFGGPPVEDKEFRRLLAHIVEQFGDDPHWENFMSRALSYHADGDFDTALSLYEKARQSILNDPNVRDEPSWKKTVAWIEALEEQARTRTPLSAAG